MNEHEIKMISYRAMTNNLIVKSTSKKLSAEEALFKETALNCFTEDLRVAVLLMERQRKQLEKDMEDGTFDQIAGGGSQQGSSITEP